MKLTAGTKFTDKDQLSNGGRKCLILEENPKNEISLFTKSATDLNLS